MSEHDVSALADRDVQRHLLVAVDGSDNSRRAVMYVADFFEGADNIFITLLTIIPEPSEDYFATEAERQAWLKEERAKMEKVLASYTDILRDAGFSERQLQSRIVVRTCTSIGDAILEEQEKLHSCIVVVGRRGINPSEEFLLGSTSSRIVHRAKHCAVLVVE